jgi:hypothetical protein
MATAAVSFLQRKATTQSWHQRYVLPFGKLVSDGTSDMFEQTTSRLQRVAPGELGVEHCSSASSQGRSYILYFVESTLIWVVNGSLLVEP